MATIAIINGPNLNRLGKRPSELYGNLSMAQILLNIQQQWPDIRFVYRQSNHEGDLIDWIQQLGHPDEQFITDPDLSPAQGIVLNAGGYSHTSVSLRDAVEESDVPVVEVHISDIRLREPFRRVSLLTDACAHAIIGKGTDGYRMAVEWLLNGKKEK